MQWLNQITAKHLRWRFFAAIVNVFQQNAEIIFLQKVPS